MDNKVFWVIIVFVVFVKVVGFIWDIKFLVFVFVIEFIIVIRIVVLMELDICWVVLLIVVLCGFKWVGNWLRLFVISGIIIIVILNICSV